MTALPPVTILDEHRLDEKPEVDQLEDVSRPTTYAPEYLNWSLLKTTRQFWRSIMFACMVALGATFDGYAVTVPGNVIANSGFITQFGTITSPLTGLLELDALHVSAWTACFTAGQFTGMIGGPLVSDWRGRKFAMIIFSAFLTLAIVLEIVAKEWGVYAVSKVFAGIGTGMIQSGLTVYVAEVSPVKIRGALLAMYSVAFGLGQLAGAIGLQIIATDMSYRKIFYSEFVFLGLFLPALFFAPESPWWAVRKGDDNLARRCLSRLYANVPSFQVEQELVSLKLVIDEEARLHPGGTFKQYIECFQGTNLRRTYISFLPLAFQQFVGIGLFFVYTTYFFQLAGYARPFEVSVIQTCIVLACIILSFFVVDRFGRRPLLLIGGAVMACCSTIVGGLGFKAIIPGTAAAGPTGSGLVALACIWSAAYALSAGPLGWTYVADTASSRLRAKTAGLAAAGTCLFGLIFGYTVPIMLSPQQANWGIKIGLLFGGLTVVGLVLIFFTIPETKGRTYAELDELFAAKISARKFKGYMTAVQTSARSTEDEV